YSQAVLSKDLATIRLDCPIEFSYEDAKIGDLFTPEAYECIKRLEFKSLLSRFDAGKSQGFSVEEHFWTVEEYGGVEQIFEKASQA
ncbi:DNA polymerase I, partial [Klebsiella oxytoca]